MKLRCKEEEDKGDHGVYGRIIWGNEMLTLQICIMKKLMRTGLGQPSADCE